MKSALKASAISLLITFLALGPIFVAPIRAETQQDLQNQLQQVEAEIAQYQDQLLKTNADKQTLTNKINQLKKQQSQLNLQIKATSLQIKQLGNKMTSTQTAITVATSKIEASKKQVGAVLQAMYKEDKKSLAEVMLASNSLSEFFLEQKNQEDLTKHLASAINDIQEQKAELNNQYADLESQQSDKKDLLSIQILQQQNLTNTTKEQNQLLKDTRGREAVFQQLLSVSQQKAQDIRARIYQLLGVSTQITFGQAVDIARFASSKTGVRAEFLLAILTQESNLGQNVGTCNRAGDPLSKSWQTVMKPSRDQTPFLAITQKLGLDPNTTPVSCPLKNPNGSQLGYGGAMGPAQFIPSTWILYEDRITAITGKSMANPWDTRDAFIAAALLLADNGATAQTENAEWRAAMLYFSGSTNRRYRFYGDNVLAIARRYATDIQTIG